MYDSRQTPEGKFAKDEVCVLVLHGSRALRSANGGNVALHKQPTRTIEARTTALQTRIPFCVVTVQTTRLEPSDVWWEQHGSRRPVGGGRWRVKPRQS